MIDIVGLGPGDLERVTADVRRLLSDPGRTVVVRTLQHPAAVELATIRPVESCDDLYEAHETFDEVYDAIATRVVGAASDGDVVYAVPGSPSVGEFAVARIRETARREGLDVRIHPAESFIDAVAAAVGIDPLRDGFKLLNGHDLPNPMVFDVPTVIGHVDLPELLAELSADLDRMLDEDVEVCLLRNLGSSDESVVWGRPLDHDVTLAGIRTSLFVPASPSGLLGAVHVMARLRRECPWDRSQTHTTLVRYLLEEANELADAIAALSGPDEDEDWGAYADVEEELGDVLLQVLFHAAIAAEQRAFDITDVAEQLRRKLVRRHPHVFGDVDAADAAAVKANWDVIKAAEKGHTSGPRSAIDGVPGSLAGLERAAELQRRAAKVGFDWADTGPVFDKVAEELEEVRQAGADPVATAGEIGDLLFAAVNLSRHLGVDPEVAIRTASHRFESRFRAMEEMGAMEGLTLEEMDARWEAVKREARGEKREA